MQSEKPRQLKLAFFVTLLAFCVILLGAYVRLSNAGLGCPDWPGCYGQLVAPTSSQAIAAANQTFPERPVEQAKAWKEMIHRYLAGALGLSIMVLAAMAWRNRQQPDQPLALPLLLLATVLFQALLGMWTVTMKVNPTIVVLHLLGGLLTLSLAWLLVQRLTPDTGSQPAIAQSRWLHLFSRLALLVLLLQITLGGWTSSNYAAIGCTEFPTCHSDSWWPTMHFGEAFVVWRSDPIDYEYGILGPEARTAIHVTHRLGAVVTTLCIGVFGLLLLQRVRWGKLRFLAGTMLILLGLQLALGVANVLAHLPLWVAVSHNGTAALLLLVLVTIQQRLRQACQ